jgi:hypothetical protein
MEIAKMENEINLFRVGDVGCDNTVILEYWDYRKQVWGYFPARRVVSDIKSPDGISEYITSSGKTGKFREKPLNYEEHKSCQDKAPAEKAAKYPWRDCKQSREYAEKMLAAGMDKEEIKKSLCALFPLTPAKTVQKNDVFASLM